MVKAGLKSLWLHRLRSILTAMGIIFGVASVIAMLAIGEGASREAQAQIARLGSTNLIVKTVKPPEERSASGEEQRVSTYGLTYDDVKRIRDTLTYAEVVIPRRRINQQAWYRNRKIAVDVMGTVPWHLDISPIRLLRGRFLSDIDMQNQFKVCAVDEELINQLFVVDEPLGKHIKVKNDYFRVVGVVTATGPMATGGSAGKDERALATAGEGVMGNLYIPLSTFKNSFGELKFEFSGGSGQAEKVELDELTVRVKATEQVLATRDILDELLKKSHKKSDYQIVVPLELLRQAASTKRIFSIVLGSIAAISLLVGGIGIMNIMLASVSERTREIGIRRALGARRRDIVLQFLSETVLLTLVGGILGMALGAAIPFLVQHFAAMPTKITGGSLVLAFGISAAVGVTFGLYPAYRAANMDPIESLRHE